MAAEVPLTTQALARWLQCETNVIQPELMNHFLLQFQSTHTRRNYANDISDFFQFWHTRGNQLTSALDTVNEKHLLLWLEQFKQSATRARKLASLSSFFRFCTERNHIKQNPCSLLRRPKVTHRKTAVALTEEEVEKLMLHLHAAAFENDAHNLHPHAPRQKASALLRFAVLHTLFSVGMRVDELCELRLCDLQLTSSPPRLHFVTKGGEEHVTAVAQSCADVIVHYLHNQRSDAKASEPVFVRVQQTNRPHKLSQTAIFQMIKSAAAEAGIHKNLSPHSARATVATVLHRRGIPLGFIQNLLNHKQITTTAKYVKKANERSESAALKAPVDLWLKGKKQS